MGQQMLQRWMTLVDFGYIVVHKNILELIPSILH
jgi:hypothetical protein